MTGHRGGARLPAPFTPAPGSRPAAVAGLVNGVAVGFPLLAGVAAGDSEAGALACLGAYVAAFTNKGGPRRQRTTGLVVAGAVNALAFGVGELVTGLFPLALALLAVLVFLAAMGPAVHGTVTRLGTMPATALLAGAGQSASGTSGASRAALLVLAGGLWYAAATGLLTPAPRLRGVLATAARPYLEVSRHLARLAVGSDETGAGHGHASVTALRRAEQAVRDLRGPGGDEQLAHTLEPLLRQASALVDLTAALAATGAPPRAVIGAFTTATEALAERSATVAGLLTHPRRAVAPPPGSADSMTAFVLACDDLRSDATTGRGPYAEAARAGRQRRLLDRIRAAADTAHRQALALRHAAPARLHPGPARQDRFDAARLRTAMTPGSSTFRHALRVTAVCTAVFTLVWAARLPHGEWASLAVLRVLRPQYGATVERAGQRITGTVIGGTCAALLIAGVEEPAVLAVVLFVVISAGFALRPVNYAFWVVFGTPLVLLIGDVAQPGDWGSALERIAMTVLGSTAALVGGYLLWPDWEHDRLGARAAEATRAVASYLGAVVEELGRSRDPSADQARRRAEGVLAEAETSLRRARREPAHDPAAVAEVSAAVETLATLMARLTALTAHDTRRAALVPGLDDYRVHAPAARPEERAGHVAALTDALDVMRLHLDRLHAQRTRELPAHRQEDTPVRRTIREHGPVIELLTAMQPCIERLSRVRYRQES